MTFVDLCKAFGSIHRGKLMEILKEYGIPTKIVDAIGLLYKDTEAQMMGLHVNYNKREYIMYYQLEGDLVTLEGNKLTEVDR